jgi:hypothetical protein
MEDVIYIWSETREGSTATDFLKEFKGVLVSDFYSAYDSVSCRQQKCLIHLIRDFNDDIHHEPFNKEMKEIAQEFATILKPIIETIDRFGLKARFLKNTKSPWQNSIKRYWVANTLLKLLRRLRNG